MSGAARLDEADPFDDQGRLERLQVLCDIAGVPRLAMHLFEAGVSPDSTVHGFARHFGVVPKPAPFPDLLTDPFPRADD